MAAPISESTQIVKRSEGEIHIKPLSRSRSYVELKPTAASRSDLGYPAAETDFTPAMIDYVIETVPYPWICDFFLRFDPEGPILSTIRRQLFGYFDAQDFQGKRLLDFGCGTGASTLGMAAMLPETEIVGVDLSPVNLEHARRMSQLRNAHNLVYLQSPDGSSLPAGIGKFDFVMLSAVFEHLLPGERPVIMPLLYDALKPGGVLFLNQTPYRYYPREHHTTGLWGLNYLPDRLTLALARRYSRETPAEIAACDWPQLLRRGIRGGTEAEVLRNFTAAPGSRATVLRPRAHRDRADYWLSGTSAQHRTAKSFVAAFFRLTESALGTIPATHLDVVIQRNGGIPAGPPPSELQRLAESVRNESPSYPTPVRQTKPPR